MATGVSFGRLLGVASGAAGVGVLLGWAMMLLSKRVPLLPIYDALRPLTAPAVVVIVLVSSLMLLVTSWALLSRRRFAPALFIGAGWVGLLHTVFAFWPRKRLMGMIEFAVSVARSRAGLPEGAGALDLIKSQVSPGQLLLMEGLLVTVAIVWLVLLVGGTVHLLRHRQEYTN